MSKTNPEPTASSIPNASIEVPLIFIPYMVHVTGVDGSERSSDDNNQLVYI